MPVFLSHLDWSASNHLFQKIFYSGYVGVSFFFVLSGFVLSYSYQEKILKGDIKRIYDLQILNFLQPSLIIKAINDKNLINKILINLLNAVAVICNTTNEKSHVDAEIKKYNNTIKFLLNNGHAINDLEMQNIVNNYLVETAKMVKMHYIDKKWNITVTKHKNMDKYKTAYLRQLFNDYNENQLMLMFTSFMPS